jgi:hypothetical protein
MRRRVIGAWVLTGLFMTTGAALAQLPGGVQIPGVGSLPTGGLSKDALLKQAKEMLGELTSMKSSGKLAPEQAKQADDLLAKTQSLTGEVEKPQVDAGRLPQLASDLSDLQKQLTVLKGAVK